MDPFSVEDVKYNDSIKDIFLGADSTSNKVYESVICHKRIEKKYGTHWVLFGYYRGEIVPKIKEKPDKSKI